MVELSIILVHFNTPELTMECIDSIYRFAPQVPFEILVVDNGSSADIGMEMTRRFPSVRFFRLPHNTGFSRANNFAMEQSHGEYFLLINSDAKLIMPGLDQMILYLKEHPQVAVLGPRQIDGNGRFQLSCGNFPTLSSEINRKILHYKLSIDDLETRDYLEGVHQKITEIDWVSGSCFLVKRQVLLEAGIFDERFFMYFEDIDLCTRIRASGYQIHYFPKVTICHHGGISAKQNLMNVFLEYRRSQIYFARKYYGLAGEVGIRGMLLAKYAYHLGLSLALLLIQKMKPKNSKEAYTKALLAKKILQCALQFTRFKPREISLFAFKNLDIIKV